MVASLLGTIPIYRFDGSLLIDAKLIEKSKGEHRYRKDLRLSSFGLLPVSLQPHPPTFIITREFKQSMSLQVTLKTNVGEWSVACKFAFSSEVSLGTGRARLSSAVH
jgi:hypothetical protein